MLVASRSSGERSCVDHRKADLRIPERDKVGGRRMGGH